MNTDSAAPDLAQCADEPIRVPGAIQPHGWMVILSADGDRLVAYSGNWPDASAAEAAVASLGSQLASLRPGDAPAPLGQVQVGARCFRPPDGDLVDR